MAQWAVIIPAEQWADERLFHHDTVNVALPDVALPDVASPGVASPAVGDEVLLVVPGDEPRAVALGVVARVLAGGGHWGEEDRPADEDDALPEGGWFRRSGGVEVLQVSYRRRAFDQPVPVDELKLGDAATALDPDVFQRLAARLGADRERLTWLVSVALPIEATSPAEAVRQFWSHVLGLGPAELPAYVWPSGDELAMQAFVLGAEANQDPEEDEDD